VRLLAPVLVAGAVLLSGCGESGADRGAAPDGVPPPSSAEATVRASPSPTPAPAPSPAPSALVPTPPPGLEEAIRAAPVLGADASWPQCPPGLGIPQKRSSGQPPPLETAEYVILGLTNGPGFTPNPCLADQVDRVRSLGQLLGVYAVASYPDAATVERYAGDGPFDGTTAAGALGNTGWQQARFNLATMQAAGAREVPVVWIDVEPVPDFAWSTDPAANAAVVRGLARGYTDAGYDIGVYSTPSLWAGVVGDLALGVPEWRAAGQTSRAEALRRCGPDWQIQGGPAVLGQWVEDARDQNVTCPGYGGGLDRWFTRLR